MPLFTTYKKLGETPLLALEQVRSENKISAEVPMTYAGRLDPAAEGLLIILSSEDVHKKDEYKNLPKVYEVDLVFGLSTDTADLLGILSEASDKTFAPEGPTLSPTRPKKGAGSKVLSLAKLVGTREQKFHSFSSKPVNGVALWEHTREKNNIEIPSHTITIEKIDVLKEETVSFGEIFERVKFILSEVGGDFRQSEIFESWQKQFEKIRDLEFQKVTVEVHCSSGTYMRVLAEEIGAELGVPVLASRILRKSIGEIKILS